jgi:hypothetical protein
MAKKRTKSDKELRQANHLEKISDTRPEQTPKKPKPRAARIVREATEKD